MIMRNIIAALLMSLAPTTVSAHAFLDHASPPVGSTIRKAPRQLSLWFTQDLEPAFSKVVVRSVTGARVDAGSRVDHSDQKLMHVSLRALRPGTYKVSWHVLSIDTHTTEGDFSFTVGGQ
jgi:methionine-rich copper-binding protein CopC